LVAFSLMRVHPPLVFHPQADDLIDVARVPEYTWSVTSSEPFPLTRHGGLCPRASGSNAERWWRVKGSASQ
jgi:hypothetical protein